MTLYDYTSAYAGVAFTKSQYQNTPDPNDNTYHTFEITANKRLSGRWAMLTSFAALKNHRWLVGSGDSAVVQSPNDLLFPIDDTWERGATINVSASREFAIVRAHKLSVKLDVYNILNANTATSISSVSGPTYGNVTSYFPALWPGWASSTALEEELIGDVHVTASTERSSCADTPVGCPRRGRCEAL